jgi:hypothetical protein
VLGGRPYTEITGWREHPSGELAGHNPHAWPPRPG